MARPKVSGVKFKISKNLLTYMKMRKWSVNDLSEALDYKKQQVSQTLSGAIEPTMNFLHRVCALTNLPANELIETVFEK
jgi:transcriptional regulator with XRE-family HTH domain